MIFIEVSLFSKSEFAAINQGPAYLTALKSSYVDIEDYNDQLQRKVKSYKWKLKSKLLQEILNSTIDESTFIISKVC